MVIQYIGGGIGHQGITEIQMCNELEEAGELEVDTEPQDVFSKGDDNCEGEDSDVSSEDFEDCDPDDEDIGLDIDDRYDKL